MKKICFRCKKEIVEGSHHYDFIEYLEGQVVKIDSAHKECWDNFMKKVSDSSEAMGIIRGLKGQLQTMGALPEDEVIVK